MRSTVLRGVDSEIVNEDLVFENELLKQVDINIDCILVLAKIP